MKSKRYIRFPVRIGVHILTFGIVILLIFPSTLMTMSGSTKQYPSEIQVNNNIITHLIQSIDENLIEGYIENITAFGSRETGTVACTNAGYYIFNEFESMGLQVRYQNFTGVSTWDGTIVSGSNIEATLLGQNTSSDQIFIICAHYDSTGPGADDDGSGVAAVLAAANLMQEYLLNYTIRFIAFSGEEQGLLGSNSYAQEANANGDLIVAVINVDMIGYTHTSEGGRKIKICADNSQEKWITTYIKKINNKYKSYIDLEIIIGGNPNSDHVSFHQYGYKAVHFFEYELFFDYWPADDDTLEHINLTYAVKTTRLICATLAELACLYGHIIYEAPFTKNLLLSRETTVI